MQDKQGFIWFAGQQGLTRFDGESSITFSHHNQQWPLPVTWLHNLSWGAGDNLLLSSEREGLWQFDPDTGQTTPIASPDYSVYNTVYHQGAYYFSTRAPYNLYRYDIASRSTILLEKNIHVEQLKQSQNKLYVATNDAVFSLNRGKLLKLLDGPINQIATIDNILLVATPRSLHSFDDDDKHNQIAIDENVTAIAPENTSSQQMPRFFTINQQGQIKYYDATELTLLPHGFDKLTAQRTRLMLHDTSGTLWLAGSQGVQRIAQDGIKNHALIFDVKINALQLATIDNQLVLGTYGQGLSPFLSPLQNLEQGKKPVLPANINRSFSQKGRRITDLLSLGSSLYITTFDGLWRYDIDSRALTRIKLTPILQSLARIKLTPKQQSLTDITLTPTQNILLSISHHQGILYVTGDDGLYLYDLAKQKLMAHLDEGNGLSTNEVLSTLTVDNGSVWLATASGINIYDTQSKKIRQLDAVGSNKVISLAFAKDKIFAATLGDGILVYNKQGRLETQFSSGINFMAIKVIKQQLWISSKSGLYLLDPTTYQLTLVPNTESLSFSDSPQLVNDVLYIGHYGGVLEIPHQTPKTFEPKVLISKTTVSGKTQLLNKFIELSSSNEVVTLDLASLDHRPGQAKRYRYMINNGQWNDVAGHQLTLTGLASGSYDIDIIGTNSLGQWSKNSTFTDIDVAYPWYWSRAMRLLYLLALVALIYTVVRLLYLRTRSISRVEHILQNDIRNRGKSALKLEQNLNMALNLIGQAEYQQAEQIIRQCTQELGQVTNYHEPDALYGKSLVVALPFLVEFIQQKYHVSLSTTIKLEQVTLSEAMQADVYKIIFQALNSAILNGNGRHFKLTLQEVKCKLWITLSDDGRSFINFNNRIHFDMGMFYVRKLASNYSAAVNSYDEGNNGSKLLISIPLMRICEPLPEL